MKHLLSLTVAGCLCMLMAAATLNAQNISGLTAVATNQVYTYTFNRNITYSDPFWLATGGTILSETQSGFTYSSTVQWNTPGSGNVRFRNGGTTVNTLNVTISFGPSTPSTSFTTSYLCGSTTVSTNTSPPSGTEWWWQTSPTGMSTSLGNGTSVNLTSTIGLYLRARANTSPFNWSASSQSAGNITVYSNNLLQPSVASRARCGTGVVTLSSSIGSGGDQVRWYTTQSNASETPFSIASSISPYLNTTTTYYVSTYNTISGCESVRAAVTATIGSPKLISFHSASSCGAANITLRAMSDPEDLTRWYTTATDVTPFKTGNIHTDYFTGGVTTYYVSSFNATSSCESSRVAITATVNTVPRITNSILASTVCSQELLIFSPNSNTSTVISWTSSLEQGISGIATSGTGVIRVTPVNSANVARIATFSITPSANGCVGAVVNFVCTIKPLPTALASNQTICSNQSTSITIANPNGVSGTTYTYFPTSVNAMGASSGSGNLISQKLTLKDETSNGNVTYSITPSAKGCSGNAINTIVTVSSRPVLTSSLTPPAIQSGSTFRYTPTSSIPRSTFNWSRVALKGIRQQASSGNESVNEVLTNTTSNPIDVTYLFSGTANGCTGPSASVIVTVNPLPNNYNYIVTRDVQSDKKADGSAITEADVASLPVHLKAENTAYFDGLGRPMQSVATQGSPSKLDIVTPVVYDAFGREKFKFLPIATGSDGYYKPNETMVDPVNGGYINTAASFYGQANSTIASDSRPFSETVFESSPLNRPAKQFGPGLAWKDNSNPDNPVENPVSHDYLINLLNEVYLFEYDVTTGLITWAGANSAAGFYDAGELYANKTTDEQGHEVIEYVDKEGRTICKKVEASVSGSSKVYASTYYIYDDMGNLAVVLPPEGVKQLTN